MCLIIKKPADVDFDDAFLQGVYDYNSDGIGVMYAENNTLFHAKYVPKNYSEVKDFWNKHCAQRECVVHFRMATHGPTVQTNSHPFQVLGPEDGYVLYLVHNGVLHTGNAKDPSKTDTELFIQDFLRPMLLKNPEFFMHPAFEELIGEFIGNGNKFVLLDAYGNMVTINEQAFVEHNGAKLSNTYAWDTTGTKYDYGSGRSYNGYNNFGYSSSWWPDYDELPKGGTKAKKPESTASGSSAVPIYARTGTDTEAEDFAIEVFNTLRDLGYTKAHRELTFNQLETFYTKAGATLANEILDLLPEGVWATDDDFLYEVRSFLASDVEPEALDTEDGIEYIDYDPKQEGYAG